jgi:hypothetical protein
MFRCEITKRLSRPLEKLHKVVVKTRPTQYRHWNRETEEEWFTSGVEIVKEVNATEEGVALWEKLSPEEKAKRFK